MNDPKTLADVKRGNTVVVADVQGSMSAQTATAAGKAWITVGRNRYHRADGRIEGRSGYGQILTETEFLARQRRSAAWRDLRTLNIEAPLIQRDKVEAILAAVRPILSTDPTVMRNAWTADAKELVYFGRVLDAAGAFTYPDDAIIYFEAPADYTPERERWIALGRPENVKIAQLQDHDPPSRAPAIGRVLDLLETHLELQAGDRVRVHRPSSRWNAFRGVLVKTRSRGLAVQFDDRKLGTVVIHKSWLRRE